MILLRHKERCYYFHCRYHNITYKRENKRNDIAEREGWEYQLFPAQNAIL